MKIRESLSILEEAPLPPDWDEAIWNDRVPFKTRVEYARQRANRIGRGSSRVVFQIPYKGRKTALKIAMNNKGAAQNRAEVQFFGDYFMKQIGILIPAIDWDEKSAYPTWIHTEFAEKANISKLQTALGNAHPFEVIRYLIDNAEGKKTSIQLREKTMNSPLFEKLQELIYNYNGQVNFADLFAIANWGIYKGKPVIIDLGLTNEVYETHYRKR